MQIKLEINNEKYQKLDSFENNKKAEKPLRQYLRCNTFLKLKKHLNTNCWVE